MSVAYVPHEPMRSRVVRGRLAAMSMQRKCRVTDLRWCGRANTLKGIRNDFDNLEVRDKLLADFTQLLETACNAGGAGRWRSSDALDSRRPCHLLDLPTYALEVLDYEECHGFLEVDVFASLLPGLRDFRTPLAVGSLWLAVLWVWFAHLVPDANDAEGLIQQMYRLTGVFGSVVLVSMMSFSGYVIGLLVSSFHLDWRPIRRLLPNRLQPLSWQSAQLVTHQYQIAIERASESGVSDRDLRVFETGAISGGRVLNVESDIRLIAMRLQGTQKDIYDDYDRFRAEAEFRRSIALPIAVLLPSVVVHVGGADDGAVVLAAIVSVVIFVLLHLLSWRKSREGNDLIIQCLLSGQVKSPTIEALDAAGEEARARRKMNTGG